MEAHPIIDYPYRWIPVLLLVVLLIAIQVTLLCVYSGAGLLPAMIDAIATISWLATLAYLAWFLVGFVPPPQTNVIVVIAGTLLWLTGSFMVCDIMVKIVGLSYVPFSPTIPFRLLFGLPIFIAVTLWYRLIVWQEKALQEKESIEQAAPPIETQVEMIDRITVKSGSRIHLIEADELFYIQACGDYVNLVTSTGEYIKEQTMKYFETHLPPHTFVRIHRSTIVNITQISRLELFGKETYMLLLKNGVKLKVSISGYRLLKEKIGL